MVAGMPRCREISASCLCPVGAQTLPVQFGYPWDEVAQQVRRGMRVPVVALVDLGVVQPEVPGEVDDLLGLSDPAVDLCHGGAVLRGKEYRVALIHVIGRTEQQVGGRPKVRMYTVDPLAGEPGRHRAHYLDLGMADE